MSAESESAIPNAPTNPRDNPEVRKLWKITLVVQTLFGITNGFYLYTFGPYFYQKFGGELNAATAMLLTMILLGVRQGLVALLEVPTGALADTLGRTYVVFLSWIIRILFFVFLAVMGLCHTPASAFAWAVLASIAFAFAYTSFNGSFSAWCVETLREKAPDVSYGWLASRFYSYYFLGELAGGLVAIYLYLKNVPFLGFMAAAFLVFCQMGYGMSRMREVKSLHFLSRDKVQFSTITRRIGEIIGRSAQVCAKTPVIFWIVLTFGSYMFLLNLVMYLWPVAFQSKAGHQEHFGLSWVLIVVVTQLLGFAGSRTLVWLNKRWETRGGVQAHLTGFRRIFIGFSVISGIAIVTLSAQTAFFSNGTWIFPAAVILVILAFGIVAPCFETLVNAFIPPEEAQHRATIMSAGSMLRSVLILILAVPSGGTSSATTTIHWAIPALLLLISALLANHFMKRQPAEDKAAAGALPEPEEN